MIHYKERDPKDTVKILKEFFKDFKIKETSLTQINGNYWCHIELYSSDGKLLLAKANGKGISPELTLASGYGELYERYCENITEIEEDEPDELDISFRYSGDEQIVTNNKNYAKEFVRNFESGKIYTSNYANLKDIFEVKEHAEVKHFSRKIITSLFGTTGLACGNSLSEAILQALCELCERSFIIDLLNANKPFGKIIKVDRNENLGLTFEYYDFSFDCGLPVIGMRVYDSKNYAIGYSFGCHPVKEIAMERCITEFTQGSILYGDRIHMPCSRLTSKNYKIEDYKGKGNVLKIFATGNGYIPFDKIANEEEICTQESGYFINIETNNNEELLLFMLKLLKDYDIYVSNISQCKGMYAVHLFSPRLETAEQLDFIPYGVDFDLYKLEMEFNGILKEAIKTRNVTKVMDMLKTAFIDYGVRIYSMFFPQATMGFELEIFMALMVSLYYKNKDLYITSQNDFQIMNQATDYIYSLSLDDQIDFEKLLEYIN